MTSGGLIGASAVPGMAYAKSSSVSSQRPGMRGSAGCSSSLSDCREESYRLLLELSSQEPTLQACFKVIESTCLARGIGLKVKGRNVLPSFQSFLDRYYLSFAETAIRHFFTLGFVPWRLRRISTGDCVPEVIPLGLFTWSIDSIPNRPSSSSLSHSSSSRKMQVLMMQQQQHQPQYQTSLQKLISQKKMSSSSSNSNGRDQVAAARAFQHQKEYFSKDNKHVPYNIRDERKMLKGGNDDGGGGVENDGGNDGEDGEVDGTSSSGGKKRKAVQINTPAYYRQQEALRRQLFQRNPVDDDETKLLRYVITFSENCGIMEEDVEIYEFMAPTNSITRISVLYGSVPSPLAHILVDYRNLRQAQMRQAYADAYNTQAKLICSYTATKNMYALPEGNPILNAEAWGPQQRMGLNTDSNLPTEIESNAYTRDILTETLVGAKPCGEHRPLVYTLPKNTSLQQPAKLESIVNVGQMQVLLPN